MLRPYTSWNAAAGEVEEIDHMRRHAKPDHLSILPSERLGAPVPDVGAKLAESRREAQAVRFSGIDPKIDVTGKPGMPVESDRMGADHQEVNAVGLQ